MNINNLRRDSHGRLGVTLSRNIVEEEFKVANKEKLSIVSLS